MQAATIDFDNPTFLIGRNGSGKSNIVDALSFLSDAMSLPLQSVFDKHGGISAVRNRTSGKSFPPNLGLGVVFGSLNDNLKGGRYAFEIKAVPDHGFEVIREQCIVFNVSGSSYWFDRTKNNAFQSNIKELRPSLVSTSLGLPVIAGDVRFVSVLKTLSNIRTYSIDPRKLKEMQDPEGGVSLKSDGSNAASVLQEISRTDDSEMQRICEILETIVPNTTRVKPLKHGNKLSLEFTQEWGRDTKLNFESYCMSDGTLRALGILTAVYQKPQPSVLVVEEPEATVHVGALEPILDLLKTASKKMQIIVTTHSPEVLDMEWIIDKMLRMVSWSEGATHISMISEASRRTMAKHLVGAGELLRSNALDAESAPLFKEVENLEPDLFQELL